MGNVVNVDKKSRWYSIAKGFGISLFLSMVGVFIYAVVLVNTHVQESTIRPVLITITGVSILIGSSISSIKIKKNGIINGICVGALYFASLYILSGIAICGFSLNVVSLIMIGVGMILGGIGGVIGVNLYRG